MKTKEIFSSSTIVLLGLFYVYMGHTAIEAMTIGLLAGIRFSVTFD